VRTYAPNAGPAPAEPRSLDPAPQQPSTLSGTPALEQPVRASRPSYPAGRTQAVDAAFAIMGLAREEGPTVEQSTLPLPHGGLDLSRTDPALASAAYLAAAAATHIAMRAEPEAFWLFDGPSGALLRPPLGSPA
jgi:hypothetical protein